LSDPPYRIDIDSIRRAFPPGIEAPPLLLDFAAWLEGRPWGTVGCFSLVGDFTDSAPIADGSPLRDQFALFARLPEGSVVGCWYGIGDAAADLAEARSDLRRAPGPSVGCRRGSLHHEGTSQNPATLPCKSY